MRPVSPLCPTPPCGAAAALKELGTFCGSDGVDCTGLAELLVAMPDTSVPHCCEMGRLLRTVPRSSMGCRICRWHRPDFNPLCEGCSDSRPNARLRRGVRQIAGDARVTVVFSPSELPQHLIDPAIAQGIPLDEIQGVLYKGHAYIVRGNLTILYRTTPA